MIRTDFLVVGGGPAGLCAAIEAAELGCKVTIVDESLTLGGQLVKQTHKFFGSAMVYAGTRGVEIGRLLVDRIEKLSGRISYLLNTSVIAVYEGKLFLCMKGEEKLYEVLPDYALITVGAQEKYLPFPNNDLPGVYGAGAVQTLMNVYGVRPGERVLMVGAGNIGLIVSYQLLQAGVDVAAVVEFAPRIGGYWVHAAKLRRLGVPILLRHTVKKAIGEKWVEGAIVQAVDEKGEFFGEEKFFKCDTICLAVGLSPTSELLWQAGCKMRYVSELGGYVPFRTKTMKTTVDHIYVAGDAAGIGEASTAMLEGRIAGLTVAYKLGHIDEDEYRNKAETYFAALNELRSGEKSIKVLAGISKVLVKDDDPALGMIGNSNLQFENKVKDLPQKFYEGVLNEEFVKRFTPPIDLWFKKKNGLVVIECPESIPCDPCHTSCPTGAITEFKNINDLPKVDYSKCTGCAICVAKCPGLACFVVDMASFENSAVVKLPYELLPRPKEGNFVDCLDREGRFLTRGKVLRVQEPAKDKTFVVHVLVPKGFAMSVRSIRVMQDE